ncbi:MAG: PAS domain S-box protein [Dehalococcoidia bacterium]
MKKDQLKPKGSSKRIPVKQDSIDQLLSQILEKSKQLRIFYDLALQINGLLLSVDDETELFQKICDALILIDLIRFVWIGLAEKTTFSIKPVANAGVEEGYLSKIKVTFDDTEGSKGPTGTAIKTGQPNIVKDTQNDKQYILPWRDEALKRGYLSSIAIPLVYEKEIIGALNVYSGVKDAFKDDEVKFLVGVAKNISLGIKSLRNIAERKQAEQALRESEAHYRLLAEHTTDSVWLMDMNRKPTYLSPSVEKVRGFTHQEIMDMPLEQTLTPESLKLSSELFFKELPKIEADPDYNPVHMLDLEYYCKDGTTIWAENKFYIIRDKNGKPVSILGEGRDVTPRKRAEEALQQSEKQYHDMIDFLPIAAFEVDTAANLVSFNQTALKVFGYSEEDYREGMNALQFFSPEEWQRVGENLEKVIQGTSIPGQEFIFLRKDGSTFTGLIYAAPVIRQNKPVGVRGAIVDITERKLAEQTLRESEEKFKNIVEHISDIFFILDSNHELVYISPQVKSALGYTMEEMRGNRRSYLTDSPLNQAGHEKTQLAMTTGEKQPPYLQEYVHRDGTKRLVEINESPLKNAKGEVIGIVGAARDVTERKISEEKLAKSYQSLKKTLNDAINTLVKIVEMRDPYTAGHQQKVADLSTAIAREMKLEDTRIDQIRMAATIHDIGKMFVPSDILSKPGKLSDMEFRLVKTHSQHGYDIVKGMDFPCSVAEAVLQHHERLDGSGYPNRLKGEDTLLEAKILTVADVVEAISSHRPFRQALGIDKALEEISKNKGKLYEPDVVGVCVELFKSGKFEFKPV